MGDVDLRASITQLKYPGALPPATTKTEKVATFFGSYTRAPKNIPGLENLSLQTALERRGVSVERNRDLGIGIKDIPLSIDVSTPNHPPDAGKTTAMTMCLLWKEEFVEARVSAALQANKPGRTHLGLLIPKRPIGIGLENPVPYSGGLYETRHGDQPVADNGPTMFEDTHAGQIFRLPCITALGTEQAPPATPLGTMFSPYIRTGSKANEKTYSTLEEFHGAKGIEVLFSAPNESGRGGHYWFIYEDSSWQLVITEVKADSNWNRNGDETIPQNNNVGMSKEAQAPRREDNKAGRIMGINLDRKPSGGPKNLNTKKDIPTEEDKIDGYLALLYGTTHPDPLMSIDLVSGQMWAVEGVHVGMLDVVAVLLGAALNLELGVKELTGGGNKDSWVPNLDHIVGKVGTMKC